MNIFSFGTLTLLTGVGGGEGVEGGVGDSTSLSTGAANAACSLFITSSSSSSSSSSTFGCNIAKLLWDQNMHSGTSAPLTRGDSP